jgi:hypothetical protein
MIDARPTDKLNARDEAQSALTFRNSVRGAGLASLLLAALVFLEFCGIALVYHDPKAFRFGLLSIPTMILVGWVAAAVGYLLDLAARGLRALGRRLVARSRSSPSARSGVWDEWLDSPGRHVG